MSTFISQNMVFPFHWKIPTFLKKNAIPVQPKKQELEVKFCRKNIACRFGKIETCYFKNVKTSIYKLHVFFFISFCFDFYKVKLKHLTHKIERENLRNSFEVFATEHFIENTFLQNILSFSRTLFSNKLFCLHFFNHSWDKLCSLDTRGFLVFISLVCMNLMIKVCLTNKSVPLLFIVLS